MKLYINPDTGEVKDSNNNSLGYADGPPYLIPDDVRVVVESQFPSNDSNISVIDLKRTLAVAGNDVVFGEPPQE